MRAIITQLPELLIRHAPELLRRGGLAGLPPRVLPTVPPPQEGVDEGAHADHAEAYGVAADVAGFIRAGTVGGVSFFSLRERESMCVCVCVFC